MTSPEGSVRPPRAARASGKPARWIHTEGRKGYTVTVYERERGAPLHGRFRHPTTGRKVRVSLRHTDRAAAKEWAADQSAKLRTGQAATLAAPAARATLARLFADYQAAKPAGRKPEPMRRMAMWARVLGAHKDPHNITLEEMLRFRDARIDGRIDAHGRTVPASATRKRVRPRAVEADAAWLVTVLRWGTKSRDPNTGQYRLQRHPLRDAEFDEFWESVYPANVRRPMAGTERYRAIRAVADQVPMECRWHGRREKQRSYLPEVLDLAQHTGRRISAILGLRWDNILLGKEYGRHGAIEWPADTDKEGKRWLIPMSPDVRAAIERVREARPGIGSALLFPSGSSPERPVTKEVVGAWLTKAEALAGVPKHNGSLWHAYRRGWATARKHQPLTDLAEAGGWTCTETLARHYLQADQDTLLKVMTEAREIRERRA